MRNEMFLHLDYYVTESSGHNSEYNCLVPQTPRPDRKILHTRHRLEPWRVRLHPGRVSASRAYLEGRSPPMVRRRDAHQLERGDEYAALHHQRPDGRRAVHIQRQRAQHRAGHQPARGGVRGGAGVGQPKRASSRCTWGRCRPSAPP